MLAHNKAFVCASAEWPAPRASRTSARARRRARVTQAPASPRVVARSSPRPALLSRAPTPTPAAAGAYKDFAVATPAPATRCVIITCMDSRLTHLLPAALNIKQGEAKIIKTAGAILSHSFGGIMRSTLVALYELRADEVFVIGHDDCGMGSLDPDATTRKMIAAGVPADRLSVLVAAGIDVKKWLKGFDSVDDSINAAVNVVRSHPLAPPGLRVTGLIIDPTTGALRLAGTAKAPHAH